MRYLLLIVLGGFFLACGTDTQEASEGGASLALRDNTVAETTTAAPAAPTPEEQIAAIRDEYDLIAREMAADVYTMDSLIYACEDRMVSGEVLRFRDAEEIRVVINSYAMGDHSGKTEYWYFQEGEPFFVLVETGAWSFGGPLEVDDNGIESPGTIDKIEQRRYYIVAGKVTRELHKAVEVKSWEEGPTIDEVPNVAVTPSDQLPAGADFIMEAMLKKEVDCSKLSS